LGAFLPAGTVVIGNAAALPAVFPFHPMRHEVMGMCPQLMDFTMVQGGTYPIISIYNYNPSTRPQIGFFQTNLKSHGSEINGEES